MWIHILNKAQLKVYANRMCADEFSFGPSVHDDVTFNSMNVLCSMMSCSKRINGVKDQTDVFGLKCHLAHYSISPAATEGNCSGLWCFYWSISGSIMWVMVTLKFRRNLSFSRKCSSTLVLDGWSSFFFLSNTFYIVHFVVYIETK